MFVFAQDDAIFPNPLHERDEPGLIRGLAVGIQFEAEHLTAHDDPVAEKELNYGICNEFFYKHLSFCCTVEKLFVFPKLSELAETVVTEFEHMRSLQGSQKVPKIVYLLQSTKLFVNYACIYVVCVHTCFRFMRQKGSFPARKTVHIKCKKCSLSKTMSLNF